MEHPDACSRVGASCCPEEGVIRSTDAIPGPGGGESRPGRSWWSWRWLLLTLALVFATPAIIFRGSDHTGFDSGRLAALQSLSPEYVFLGNSLLETRIDPEHMSDLLSGARVASLAEPGAQSAVWFLQLKNLAAEITPIPTTVFVFFRNDLITQATARTRGHNRELIGSLSHSREPEFDRIIAANSGVEEQLLETLEDIYPVQSQRSNALSGISLAAAVPLASTRDDLSSVSEDLFTFANLRDDARDIPIPTASLRFEDAVGDSFLPEMIRLSRDRDFKIVFVRIQTKPRDDGSPRQSEALSRYAADLGDYMSEQGVPYVDFTGDPDVDAGLYYDGYHIQARYLEYYTDLFFDRLRDHFDPPPSRP